MSYLSSEKLLPIRSVQQPQCPVHMTRLKAPRTYNLQLLSGDGVWVEADIPRIGVLPEHQKARAVTAIFQALVHGVRVSDTLYDDVCAVSAGFEEHLALPFRGADFRDIDRNVRPEITSKLQPVRWTARNDQLQCAGLLCHSQSCDSYRSRALHHDNIAPLHWTALDPVNRCGERTSRSNDSFGR
jgi:hypothetical protein